MHTLRGKANTCVFLASRGFDFYVDTSGKAQLIERLDRLGSRLHNVDQPLVGANLKLLPSLSC